MIMTNKFSCPVTSWSFLCINSLCPTSKTIKIHSVKCGCLKRGLNLVNFTIYCHSSYFFTSVLGKVSSVTSLTFKKCKLLVIAKCLDLFFFKFQRLIGHSTIKNMNSFLFLITNQLKIHKLLDAKQFMI